MTCEITEKSLLRLSTHKYSIELLLNFANNSLTKHFVRKNGNLYNNEKESITKVMYAIFKIILFIQKEPVAYPSHMGRRV